jgi:hypothetical protein
MKKAGLISLLMGVVLYVHAQNWDEWFQQKKTQIKYLAEQIALLNTYGSAVNKGYKIAQEGLANIGKVKEGDFNLHRQHFASLTRVNEAVKNGGDMKDIELIYESIQRVYEKHRQFVRSCRQFSSGEMQYFSTLFKGVMEKANDTVEEGLLLLSDDQLQLSDDERIRRLTSLRNKIKDLYAFVASFEDDVTRVAILREMENRDIKRLRQLN